LALQRQLARQMARALAGPAQGRLRIAPRQRRHQTIQLNVQLWVGLAQTLAATVRLAQPRTHFKIGAAFSGRQLGQPFAYRVRRHPRGVAHRTHTTPTIGTRFSRRPMPPRSLIQHRCKRPVLRFDLLYREYNLNSTLEHTPYNLSSYLCAGSLKVKLSSVDSVLIKRLTCCRRLEAQPRPRSPPEC